MRRLLIVLASALVVAFVVLPGRVAGSRDLTAEFPSAFVRWWQLGGRDYTPELQRIVDYWFRYHLVKGAIAATLLVVVIVLGARLRRSVLPTVAVTALGLLALAAVMANIQGAVAPFASLFPLLPADARQQPAAVLRTGERPPALAVMIDDYTLYHAAMIGIAGTVAVALLGASVALSRAFRRASDRRARRVSASFGVLSALLTVAAIVVTVANITTTLDPESGLLALFEGNW